MKDHSGKDRIDWRPKDPWPAGTKVSVKGALDCLDAGNGGWFARDYDCSFTVGSAHRAVVDVPSHTLTMYDGDCQVGQVRGSAGSAQTPTRGGTHTVTSKIRAEAMDSQTIGFGDQWSLKAKWVVYRTASGRFSTPHPGTSPSAWRTTATDASA
ncbi:Ig-like domain-containing protein [Streptomyces mauvecolor]